MSRASYGDAIRAGVGTPVDEDGRYDPDSERTETRRAYDYARTIGRYAARCSDPRRRDRLEAVARKLSGAPEPDQLGLFRE